MYDIRQFRTSLYALVILGMTGFCIAAESGGIWVLAVGATLLNLWWVYSGSFIPLPRLIANTVTLLSVCVLGWMIRSGVATAPILLIGQFLMLLQIVKLYEQRANRDYAQLLVLGPLLMVAGAISTYSLVFGLMFIAYVFLWLHCCLLFHLKVETDMARQMMGVPQQRSSADLRSNHRAMNRSIRRLTALISFFAVCLAVLSFLFFPRMPGAGMFSPLQWRPRQALTAFSDSVNFQDVAMITQNNEPVAWVTVTRDGQPYSGFLMLRGTTLDRYSGRGDEVTGAAFQWTRTAHDQYSQQFPAGQTQYFDNERSQAGELRQQIKLDPTRTPVLFAIAGIHSFTPYEIGRFNYTRRDEVLQASEPIAVPIQYEATSRNKLTSEFGPPTGERPEADRKYIENIDPEIKAFALKPEVSGSDATGPLAARRSASDWVSPLDAQIADNIEIYLRTNFTYTLDLTDAANIRGKDPLVAFLYDFKRGHCEYFAGAMTLMCQSLGMQVRMVVGFKCGEYNPFGNYYTVLQSHAHAWVEVLNDKGVWLTFDPTSGRQDTVDRNDTLWQRAWALFSFLQYTWANTVVAYDPSHRAEFLPDFDSRLVRGADNGATALNRTMKWFSDQRAKLPQSFIGWLITLMAFVLAGIAGGWVWKKTSLRRRARRIGLDALPEQQRLRLTEQLHFYEQLQRLLERYRLYRPAHLTPLEFSQTLSFLPVDAYHGIRRLTEAFYHVRYGRAELTNEEQRQLLATVTQIQQLLVSRR